MLNGWYNLQYGPARVSCEYSVMLFLNLTNFYDTSCRNYISEWHLQFLKIVISQLTSFFKCQVLYKDTCSQFKKMILCN